MLHHEMRSTLQPNHDEISSSIKTIRSNAKSIPHTMDAIESLIALEVERLQNDNFLNATCPNEVKRQISTLSIIYEAICGLRRVANDPEKMDEKSTEKSLRLVEIFSKKIRSLVFEKADDFAEGLVVTSVASAQAGLVLGGASLAQQFMGIIPPYSIPVLAFCIAPEKSKNLLEAFKNLSAPTKK